MSSIEELTTVCASDESDHNSTSHSAAENSSIKVENSSNITVEQSQEKDTSSTRPGVLPQHSSLWERFLIKAQNLAPTALSDLIDNEKKKILQEMDHRGYLTQEEADYFNKMTQESIEKILHSFKESCLKHFQVSTRDSPAQVKFKIGFAEELIERLPDLFSWIINKIREIFQVTGERLEWCIEQTKKLFECIKKLLN